MPRPGRGERRGAEERHRDRVLDRRRAGQRRHREGRGAERDRRRHQPVRDVRRAEQRLRHRRQHEERDEQADAAVGDQRAGEHDREHRALRPEPLGHEARDRRHRAAVLHQLAEQRAEQEQREELHEESRRRAHEGLRPVGEQRLARDGGGDQRRGGRQHQHAPAAKGQPDEQRRGRAGCRAVRCPWPQTPSSSASRSSVERTPRSAPCASRNAVARLAALVAQHAEERPFGDELRRIAEFEHDVARDAVDAHPRPDARPRRCRDRRPAAAARSRAAPSAAPR